MNGQPTSDNPALPRPELAARQAAALRGARSRLLRRADIARRRRVLELGAGWGCVTEELLRRSAGTVTAIDRDPRAIAALTTQLGSTPSLQTVVADAEHLPFANGSFDLVFAQFTWLWIGEPRKAAMEAARVLQPGGMLVAIEPDYGGLMETPPETALQPIWLNALCRTGAHPTMGRQLPGLLANVGLRVETRFPDRLEAASIDRFDLLEELPLTMEECQRVQSSRTAAERLGPRCIAHLPLWLIMGEKN